MEIKIDINDNACWCCGADFNPNNKALTKTLHHAIEQKLKPKRNVLIPICRYCHNQTHKTEDNVMKGVMWGFIRKVESFKRWLKKEHYEQEMTIGILKNET